MQYIVSQSKERYFYNLYLNNMLLKNVDVVFNSSLPATGHPGFGLFMYLIIYVNVFKALLLLLLSLFISSLSFLIGIGWCLLTQTSFFGGQRSVRLGSALQRVTSWYSFHFDWSPTNPDWVFATRFISQPIICLPSSTPSSYILTWLVEEFTKPRINAFLAKHHTHPFIHSVTSQQSNVYYWLYLHENVTGDTFHPLLSISIQFCFYCLTSVTEVTIETEKYCRHHGSREDICLNPLVTIESSIKLKCIQVEPLYLPHRVPETVCLRVICCAFAENKWI